jgi:predicted nucleotidyltransferase
MTTLDITHYQFFQRLASLYCIDAIWLHGSRARRDHRERSDIDLAIICPRATEREWGDILDIIEESDTLLKIDCVRFDELQPEEPLTQNILHDKVILFQRETP